jgi:glucan-binding YG repeat protein
MPVVAETYPKWVKAGDTWYYRIAEGENAHGWRDINGHRYWFDEKGAMATEWREIDGEWYYFQPESGKAAALAGALYVTDETGAQFIMTC